MKISHHSWPSFSLYFINFMNWQLSTVLYCVIVVTALVSFRKQVSVHKQPPEVFCKKGVLRNSLKIHRDSFLTKLQAWGEHLWTTASICSHLEYFQVYDYLLVISDKTSLSLVQSLLKTYVLAISKVCSVLGFGKIFW